MSGPSANSAALTTGSVAAAFRVFTLAAAAADLAAATL